MFALEVLLFHKIWSSNGLFKRNRLLWHQWVSLLLFFDLFIIKSVFLLWFSRKLGNSFWLSKHLHSSTLISLSKMRSVMSRLWIDIMREKVISINRASVNWIGISHTISMPCWFSKECSKGRIWEPSGCFIQFVDSVDPILQ